MKRIIVNLSLVLILLASLGLWQTAQAGVMTGVNELGSGRVLARPADPLAPALRPALAALQPGDMLTVIVTLRQQADFAQVSGSDRATRQESLVRLLQATANATQGRLASRLAAWRSQGLVKGFASFWVFNGFSVTATGAVITDLAQDPDVLSITPDGLSIVPALAPAAWNIAATNAPALWGLGDTGQGVVVANLDSGVDASHPDLSARYRGGSNSWFDPYAQHAAPADLTGHGTWTMGIMLAGDLSGATLGMAPGAQWIAAKIFNDSGSSTATAIHQSFQWLLDPDGNPATADAPQVVNNSWSFATPGCNLDFEPDLQALRAAGILPVFAAGNYGPYSNSSASPANNPSAFAVGAIDASNQIYAYSSRGPNTCGGSNGVFPELVAPGVNITTTDLFGGYTLNSGTSFSAPHAAGALALLISANPNLSAADQESALLNGAADLGAAGPDDTYGYGRLDVLAAYNWLAAGNHATATPTPLPTATPTPTATSSAPVNLALNRPVTVSSYQDSSTTGAMAVDGDLGTLWKTIKYSGKNKPASEWLVVDLGSSQAFSQVVLEWDAYYATTYSIDVSSDNSTWTSVFSTTGGNGGNDTLSFAQVSARYVRLMTTGWSNTSLRDWLRELQVYAGSGAPAPTATATPAASPTPTATPAASPTPTATPLPSPTPQPGGSGSAHIGDLDGTSAVVNRKNWSATVTILVHDSSENPLAGVTVSGSWSNGSSGTCLTGSTGVCQVSSGNINNNTASLTFSVTDASAGGYTYAASLNHDPDGDSNGTTILVVK